MPKGNASIFKNEAQALPTTGITGALCSLPGVRSTHELLLKSGLGSSIGSFMMTAYIVFLVMIVGCYAIGIRAPLLLFFGPLLGAFFLVRKHLKGRIRKRNEKFILLFPDAVDMIVRSVRSGHPLNTALRMISENMENPVREEFKQVVDEISYGRTLPEALQRLAQRVGEQDIHFFVVVLSVQQETGGSLAEVLTNLSTIIRKRRQLRLKIRALTSEGRATSYILGAIPFVEIGALSFITPGYLDILFTSGWLGYTIFGSAMFLIFSAILIVRRMANIDI
jgi:tight adherence protein B